MERRRQTSRSNMEPEQEEAGETTPLKKGKEPDVHGAKATVCSRWQAPLQSWLRPAMWIPGLKRLHSHREIWKSAGSSVERNMNSVVYAVMKLNDTDTSRSVFTIPKMKEDFLQIHVFTRAEWLDVIEMRFEDDKVKVSAFSSGFLPLCLPGACFLNVLFFWVPFLDCGMNQKRLKWILDHMDVPMQSASQ